MIDFHLLEQQTPLLSQALHCSRVPVLIQEAGSPQDNSSWLRSPAHASSLSSQSVSSVSHSLVVPPHNYSAKIINTKSTLSEQFNKIPVCIPAADKTSFKIRKKRTEWLV
jgi:hypothetical protein